MGCWRGTRCRIGPDLAGMGVPDTCRSTPCRTPRMPAVAGSARRNARRSGITTGQSAVEVGLVRRGCRRVVDPDDVDARPTTLPRPTLVAQDGDPEVVPEIEPPATVVGVELVVAAGEHPERGGQRAQRSEIVADQLDEGAVGRSPRARPCRVSAHGSRRRPPRRDPIREPPDVQVGHESQHGHRRTRSAAGQRDGRAGHPGVRRPRRGRIRPWRTTRQRPRQTPRDGSAIECGRVTTTGARDDS